MRVILYFLLSWICCVASAQISKPSQSRELIQRYAGAYEYDTLLKEPFVESQLRALLGRDYRHFMHNMSQLRNPIDLINGGLSAEGRRNDEPEREVAFICVESYKKLVHAAIYSGTQLTVYSTKKTYKELPACMQQWVYLVVDHVDDSSMPPAQGNSEFSFRQKVINDK
jgi:hypothetical protein